MSIKPLSKDQQDAIVVDLSVNISALSEEEFEDLYRQLDAEHQLQVDADVRRFADDAVGDEHWDSDD